MTDDIEIPTTTALDVASPRKTRSPEEAMRVTIAKSIAVSVPLAIAIFVGMVALALRNQNPDWNAYLAMAAGIGVIAGAFFGLLMGFTLTSHNFE
jgi:ribose/xylose/arabinose/galactoside ABC-type transport system permease subunit